MEKFVVSGGKPLKGTISVSGAKNVALKALVAACMTDEQVVIENIPLIADLFSMMDIMKELGANVRIKDHTAYIRMNRFKTHEISLDYAARSRASSMFIAPLLARIGRAMIPNPGGCRLGARPIDRTIEGLRKMQSSITYHSEDGWFHAETKGLKATTYTFQKSTHTGTETLILAASIAEGKTTLKNAAEEPEIDELIALLTQMGAQIKRSDRREITITGVKKLKGTKFAITPDRNEIVTFAVAAILTEGDIVIEGARKEDIEEFLETLAISGGGVETTNTGIRFFFKGSLYPTQVTTSIYPGFMTDWQAPWAVLMTKAKGISTIHETVFENRFGYVQDLRKMGARIDLFNPKVTDRKKVYNFNGSDDKPEYYHAIKIHGPTKLHNAVVTIPDLRAGATLVLAALSAKGTTTIYGISELDRGYENFEKRLGSVGAVIKRARGK